MRGKKRILSLLLCGAMLFSLYPQTAAAEGVQDSGFSAQGTGLCEHHQQHTDECGYTEGTAGTPCSHEHTEECYTLVTSCVHEHTDECYPAGSVSGNTATPSQTEETKPTECTHVCSEESGCITEVLDCKHEHDEDCGYTPATEGTPCTFVCEICSAEDSGEPATPSNAIDSAVTDVQALIDALPTAEELESMSQDEQAAVYEQVQAAYDAYTALTTDQQEQITGAEVFNDLFAVFNSMTNALDTAGDFTITGGSSSDYSYSGGVLTILTDTELTISNTNSSTATTDRIVINSGVNANLTLAGVNIQAPAQTSAIDVPSGASLTLTLENNSTNTLAVSAATSSLANNAGIHVPEGASLTIQCATASGDNHQCNDACGHLTVTGGEPNGNGFSGAGIGGNGVGPQVSAGGENSGTIRINGGNITITGGTSAYPGPGIGGGSGSNGGGDCGEVYITGGIVSIYGGSSNASSMPTYGAAGIGGGNTGIGNSGGSGGIVVITGGTVVVTGGNGTSTSTDQGPYSGYGGAGIGGGSSAGSGGTGGDGGTVIILTEVNVKGGQGVSSGSGGTPGNAIGGGFGSSGSNNGDEGDGIRPSSNGNYTVYGNPTLPEGVTLPDNITINIPDGTSLTLPEGASWPDNVTITGSGSIDPKLTATITISANLNKTYDGNAVSLDSTGYTYTGDTTTPTINITWHEDNNGTIGNALTSAPSATGIYWVKVSAAETSRYAAAEATKRFTISQPLAAPTGLAWSTTTPGQATWNTVTNASGYDLQLYKDGSAQGSPVTASGTSYDFANTITQAGRYTFTVTATGSGAYSDSSPSSQSAALYTVSFDTNGGTGTIPMQLVPNGGTATAPAEPTRTGHRFDGWYSDSTFAEGSEWTFATSTVTAATTLYAKWTAIDYDITITVQGGTGNTASASVNSTTATSANMGDTVTLTATPAEDYHFVEWQVTSGGATISEQNTFTMPAGAVAITAIFEEHTFTGWTANGNDTHTGTCSCGETSTENCTYENGTCTVCGYVDVTTTDPANSTVKEGETATFTVTATGNGISYQWQISTDGSAWADIDRANSSSYTTQAATMDMDGYQYRCVVSNATGDSDTSSAATLTVNKTPSTIDPAFIGYFVEHYQQDPESGAYELYEREYFVDEINAEVTATPKTYTGYTYNSAAAGTVTSGTLTKIEDEADIVTLKLYYDPESYSVTLEAGDGTIDSGNVTEYTYGIGAALPTAEDMTYNGYVFQGWYESSDFSGEAVTAISATDTGNKTYYAKWTKLYTVTVTAESGGTVSGGGTFEDGSTVTVTATANSGYRFVCWTENGAEVSTSENYIFDLTADRSLTAEFVRNSGGGGGGGTTTPTYTNRTLSSNGVTLSGSGVHRNARLTATEGGLHEAGSCASCDQIRAWQAEGRVIAVYDVSLSQGFQGNVTITFPVPSSYNGRTLTVVHCLDNELETYQAAVTNGTIRVTVDSLSPFAILDTKDNPDTGFTNPFTDVNEGDWFYNDVMYVYQNGLMVGTSDTTFSPNDPITRAQVAVIFYRMAGSPAVTGDSPFTDVVNGPGTAWYYDAVLWAQQNGIVSGYGDGTFHPGTNITREQLAVIFYNYAKYKGYDVSATSDLSGFTDAGDVSSWALDAMRWAVGSGVMGGYGDGILGPQGTATRAQVAAMLHRFIENNNLVPPAVLPGGDSGTTGTGSGGGWTQQVTSPQTGDSSNVGLWFSLMLLSLSGIVALLVTEKVRRRKMEDEEAPATMIV